MGERNNAIPEEGRKQTFDGCPKRKEELDEIVQILCTYIYTKAQYGYFSINGIYK